MNDFLGLFKDCIYVSIPKAGGTLLHTRVLQKVLDRNIESIKDGAYFTVNGFAKYEEGSFKGRTKNNVTSFNANFLDIDLTPETRRTEAEAIYKMLCDSNLKPTAVVLTGKGLHVYWVYKEPYEFSEYKLKEYEVLQTAIVESFKERGADKQARDAARVLRIPGANYFNSKGEISTQVELLYFNPDTKYEPKEIAAYFKNSIRIDSEEGEALLKGEGDFDLSTIFNVKKGGRHHTAYSAALSLIQRSKSLKDARELFNAAINTWESTPEDHLSNIQDYWNQFENAIRMLEKDRPQLFATDTNAAPISIKKFKDIEIEEVEWFWDGILAKGKSHILSGVGGLGKSQITIDIAARLSKGLAFPSYTVGDTGREPLSVIILSAEDGAADTIKPRILAAGGDDNNIYSMASAKLVKQKNGKSTMSTVALKEDAEAILEAIATLPAPRVGLIIIDPASAFMSEDADANSNKDVREMLAQLQSVIMDKGIAIIMINHLNKNTGAKSAAARSLGSTAWTNVARSTMYAFADPEYIGTSPEDRRFIFSPDKTNLAKKKGNGFYYTIKEEPIKFKDKTLMAPRIEWNLNEFPTKDTDEYMSQAPQSKPKREEAEEELEMLFMDKQSISTKEGLEYMKERGFTKLQAFKAARKLNLIGKEHGVWQK